MFGIGPMELVVIVVVALLIFGPQRLPELARALGKGLAEFRRASNDLRQTLALDELQNDLRKTANQIANPTTGRPAQAGDGLPPGPAAGAARSAGEASTTSGEASPEAGAAGAAAAASSPTPAWKDNPGELPLDRDHEHHDPGEDEASDAGPRLSTADSGLGNVPVTGANPPDPRRG